MSDALSCDGPDCTNVATSPYEGWWRLTHTTSLLMFGGRAVTLDFCSWECLGAFTFQRAGDVLNLTADDQE